MRSPGRRLYGFALIIGSSLVSAGCRFNSAYDLDALPGPVITLIRWAVNRYGIGGLIVIGVLVILVGGVLSGLCEFTRRHNHSPLKH